MRPMLMIAAMLSVVAAPWPASAWTARCQFCQYYQSEDPWQTNRPQPSLLDQRARQVQYCAQAQSNCLQQSSGVTNSGRYQQCMAFYRCSVRR
jgi:hypothetical protein